MQVLAAFIVRIVHFNVLKKETFKVLSRSHTYNVLEAQQPKSDLGRLTGEVSRSHTIRHTAGSVPLNE
jgi:hypothetical protein